MLPITHVVVAAATNIQEALYYYAFPPCAKKCALCDILAIYLLLLPGFDKKIYCQ
jgi:hypothetical protein